MIRPLHTITLVEGDFSTTATIERETGNGLWASYAHMQFVHGFEHAMLHNVEVHRNYRRRGLGRELLREVCLFADLRGWSVMLTAVGNIDGSHEELVKWYERCGWLSVEEYGFTMVRPPAQLIAQRGYAEVPTRRNP